VTAAPRVHRFDRARQHVEVAAGRVLCVVRVSGLVVLSFQKQWFGISQQFWYKVDER
jgi:hypothetical protein